MSEKHNPATAATAKKNAEVYKFLDFNDKQEAEFARRGLIAAPEELPAAEPAEPAWSESETAPAVYVWPLAGEIARSYSSETLGYDPTMRDWRTHPGLDIDAPAGSPVVAAHEGMVSRVWDDDLYGTVVCVDHGDGIATLYANLAASPAVQTGDWVEPGSVIGAVGTSALCEVGQPAHLHFAVTVNGMNADPREYLPA